MTWLQIVFAALIACVLLGCWYRFSIEKSRVRRLAELYLWLGPILPFSALVEVRDAGGFTAFVPAGVAHLGLIGIAVLRVTAPAVGAGAVPRLAGALLILGSTIVWLGAVTFPGMQLDEVASHRADHWFTSGTFLLGALITLAGFSLLATLLHDAGERVYSQLGQSGFLLGVVAWALHLAFRATVMVSAAQESTASGTAPAWYGPLRLWSGAMYALYMSLAYLATSAYGAAMLKTGWAGKGWGRTFVIFGVIATAVFLARLGFDVPLAVQFMPYAMGMLLLRRAARSVRGETGPESNRHPQIQHLPGATSSRALQL